MVSIGKLLYTRFYASTLDSFLMKIIVAIAFILIIGSLGSALVFLMRNKGVDKRTAQALTFRVGFSVALFILILVAHHFGWIHPTGIRTG